VVRHPHCERANARNVAVRRRQPYLGRKFTALAIETHPIHHQLALSFGLVIHTLTRREGKRQYVPYSSCLGVPKILPPPDMLLSAALSMAAHLPAGRLASAPLARAVWPAVDSHL
jgi:hypothetical protein